MPQVDVDGLKINYDVQGAGEPLRRSAPTTS